MTKTSKELTEFIRDVNKGILCAVYTEVSNTKHPQRKVLCIMEGLNVAFDVRVNADGHVTHGQDVAAKLHFHFTYNAEKLEEDDDNEKLVNPYRWQTGGAV